MMKEEVMVLDSNVLPEGLSLPALFLNVNAFDENCEMIASKAQGKRSGSLQNRFGRSRFYSGF